MVPFPGKPRPMASVRQFMELAVNMPAQEPQVGQALSSISASCDSLILPERTAPTASNTVIRSTRWVPASGSSERRNEVIDEATRLVDLLEKEL